VIGLKKAPGNKISTRPEQSERKKYSNNHFRSSSYDVVQRLNLGSESYLICFEDNELHALTKTLSKNLGFFKC
jgi:hypothetical protein